MEIYSGGDDVDRPHVIAACRYGRFHCNLLDHLRDSGTEPIDHNGRSVDHLDLLGGLDGRCRDRHLDATHYGGRHDLDAPSHGGRGHGDLLVGLRDVGCSGGHYELCDDLDVGRRHHGITLSRVVNRLHGRFFDVPPRRGTGRCPWLPCGC